MLAILKFWAKKSTPKGALINLQIESSNTSLLKTAHTSEK